MGSIHSTRPICFLLVLTLTLGLTVASAHESPETTIHALSEDRKLAPVELHQRALAYHAAGNVSQAISDLQTAIIKDSENLGYQLELTRMQLAAGEPVRARHTADRALRLATFPDQRATIQILRAESYQLDHNSKDALAATQQAFQEVTKGEIEWFLLRSECQRALGLSEQRIIDLASGLKKHPSAVLRSHWIDALVDAGHFSEALQEINCELTDRRWKSSYLIKRARALIGLGQLADAKTSLHLALAELGPRLNPDHPDSLLLADRGVAYALLGEKTEAQRCLELLRQHRAPDWIIVRLQQAIVPQ